MKCKIYVILLFAIIRIGVQSQTVINVHEKNTFSTPFSISSIKKITLSEGSFIVNKKDGNSNSFALTNVAYLDFSGIINSMTNKNIDNKLIIYPNPVLDVLNVKIPNFNMETTNLEIWNVNGKLVLYSKLNTETTSISVSGLSKGMYLCRYSNGGQIISSKFIKQ